MKKILRVGSLALCLLLFAVGSAMAEPPLVMIFNFQMRSETPEWRWVEKGMADYLITELCRSGKAQVVDRDKMQDVAERYHWVPEMLTVPGALQMINGARQPSHFVSGFYEVRADRLSLTIMVMKGAPGPQSGTNQPNALAFQKTLTAKTDDIGELHRKAIAELVAWFTNGSPEQALPAMRPWYRNVSAARALYEGVDCYDKGRYADAWLCFREGVKGESDSIEIRYWVAKMLYFLGRYEHARPDLARFIREYSWHPRVADALKEYVHTFEKANLSAEDLLSLYEEMARDPKIANVGFPADKRESPGATDDICFTAWMVLKRSELLEQIGRHKEAAARKLPGMTYGLWDPPKVQQCLINHHKRTCETPGPEFFGPELTDFGAARYDQKIGKWAITRDPYGRFNNVAILAPDKQVFRRLRMKPLFLDHAPRAPFRISVVEVHSLAWTEKDIWGGALSFLTVTKRAKQASEDGVELPKLPLGGMLLLKMEVDAQVLDLGIEAEFDPMPTPGCLLVECTDSVPSWVEVDGRFGGRSGGLVGPLAPGEHAVRLHGAGPGVSNLCWEGNVKVEAGKTTLVGAWLSDPKNAGASKPHPILVGHDYPTYMVSLQSTRRNLTAPSIQADNDAVRVVWEEGGDLWVAEIRDGKTVCRLSRLELPVSTAWVENRPTLLRDFSGRFLLFFLSDRSRQHDNRLYSCWSRDLKRWSNPMAISDGAVRDYDVILTRDQKIVVAQSLYAHKPLPPKLRKYEEYMWRNEYSPGRQLEILESKDAVRWERLCNDVAESAGFEVHDIMEETVIVDGRWPYMGVRLIERPVGQLNAIFSKYVSPNDPWDGPLVSLSSDGRKWTLPEHLSLHKDLSSKDEEASITYDSNLLSGSTWSRGIHPRWGVIYAWTRPRNPWMYQNVRLGPFMLIQPP